MFISLSKSDVLQSLGFALTAATEEHEGLLKALPEGILRALTDGTVVSEDEQRMLIKKLADNKHAVERLKMLTRMAEFGKDDEPCVLSEEDFALIEPNLPAR